MFSSVQNVQNMRFFCELAISSFSQEILSYCANASHVAGLLKSIVRRHSFSKKSENILSPFLIPSKTVCYPKLQNPSGTLKMRP